MTQHTYTLDLLWTGNRGTGTSGYRAYSRNHDLTAPGAGVIAGSADPAFRGDPARWNPEQLLLASVAQCHMLWYLHLASVAGVVVTGYADHPEGVMVEESNGAGQFSEVTLNPVVRVATAEQVERARELHGRVGEVCFIARSVNFPIRHRVTVEVGGGEAHRAESP
ncbi:OsmC family protein [Klugiella xanthotipulae]|uniref:Organic hydroperoxide reductase OsmC/OhrA n=1 Tax=Klugiella xanthotipulae TaxID=244735 RepID=A0A543I689_9MICO|nr:OsmC family protein [Klugiella xanthotipulae]TQM66126.1 organic hydroperoxide reductase OsmC/OhrA [Klugiella xanthotipulae]